MNKTVKVTYNADTLQTTITVDGNPFDTSRISGKEIADWAYPFIMRKIKWNGFYDEMVEAIGGDKEFNLIFEGSDEALAELKEAWEDAPVKIVSGEDCGNIVVIEYDDNTLTTNITVNGQHFDTSRINGKEIADWVYPFIIRKIKWDGIFDELTKVIGSDEYIIQFAGKAELMEELIQEKPDTVKIDKIFKSDPSTSKYQDTQTLVNLLNEDNEEAIEYLFSLFDNENGFDEVENLSQAGAYVASLSLAIALGYGTEEDDEVLNDNECCQTVVNYIISGVNQCKAVNGQIIDSDMLDEFDKIADKLDECEKYEYSYKIRDVLYPFAKKNRHIILVNNLAWHCRNGYGTEKNINKAINLYMYSAESLDSVYAYKQLGNLYIWGGDVATNYINGFKYAKIAADNNDTFSMADVAYCYENGYGTNQDIKAAISYYQQAADDGNEFAQSRLSDLLNSQPKASLSIPPASSVRTETVFWIRLMTE